MFTTIVWATDGSDSAANAYPVARDLAEVARARVVTVHVEEVAIARAGVPVDTSGEKMGAVLRRNLDELRQRGVHAVFRSAATPGRDRQESVRSRPADRGARRVRTRMERRRRVREEHRNCVADRLVPPHRVRSKDG